MPGENSLQWLCLKEVPFCLKEVPFLGFRYNRVPRILQIEENERVVKSVIILVILKEISLTDAHYVYIISLIRRYM